MSITSAIDGHYCDPSSATAAGNNHCNTQVYLLEAGKGPVPHSHSLHRLLCTSGEVRVRNTHRCVPHYYIHHSTAFGQRGTRGTDLVNSSVLGSHKIPVRQQ